MPKYRETIPELATFLDVDKNKLSEVVNDFLIEKMSKFTSRTKVKTGNLVITQGSLSKKVNCYFFWSIKIFEN